jgi:hypothetical protein
MNAVFRLEGNVAVSSGLAAGPWDPTLQHGAAPAALIASAAERLPSAVPMRVARLAVDLLRPVPVAPLEIRSGVVREGRKIQLCQIQLFADGMEVVRGSVLKIRAADIALPDHVAQEPVTLPGPEAGRPPKLKLSPNPGFNDSLSVSVVKGDFHIPGPAAVWYRLDLPIIAGEAITPLMRAVAAADFCNGTSSVLDFREWTFINGDLTLSLARQPAGEWVLLDAETWLGPEGAGIASAKLADTTGYFGRAVQSILVEPRPQRIGKKK